MLLCFFPPTNPRILHWLELLDEQRAALDDGLPMRSEDSSDDGDGEDGESQGREEELGPLEDEMWKWSGAEERMEGTQQGEVYISFYENICVINRNNITVILYVHVLMCVYVFRVRE